MAGTERAWPALRGLALALVAALAPAGCSGGGAAAGQVTPIKGVWHATQAGDTADRLARLYRVPVQDIEEINGLERHAELRPGRKVFVPGATASAAGVASPRAAGGARQDAAPATTGADVGPARGAAVAGKRAAPPKLSWPLPGGKISSRFGRRGKRTHEGLDISAPEGTAVLAAAGGTVIYAGSGIRGYGNLVIIRHAGGLLTVYAHNRRNLVSEGVKVRQGQVIAEVGHSGRASGNHLHFEVREGEKPVDPLRHVHP